VRIDQSRCFQHEFTWDLTPDSTMTNATVEAAVSEVAGRVPILSYKDGQQELVVRPGTPVMTLAPGDASSSPATMCSSAPPGSPAAA